MKFKLGKASSSLARVLDDEIEFNTLEELVNWVKENGEDVIILHDEDTPSLYIYDSYIE